MVKVTKVQLLQIMPTAASRIDKYLSYINSYAEVFEIDTQLRMAHYLAQIAHESGELRWTVEQGSKGYFDKYDTGKLAKMLGNTPQKDGDGYKYRGRGLIQITGRANYDAYNRSAYCKGDVMKNPELLEKPLGAVKSSMWWWKTHGLNILPPLIKRINKEKRNSKNYVLFLGATDAESNQAPCLSLVQFQLEDGALVVSAYQRSSDANLGLPSDIYHLYLMARQIDLPLKYITLNLANVHIYENNIKPTERLLAGEDNIKFELNV